MTRLAISILIMLLSFHTRADDAASCGSVRLDKNGGPLSQIPIYNQQKFGSDADICWAIAAAELIDADRAKGGTKLRQFTSPLSLAFSAISNDDIRIYNLSKIPGAHAYLAPNLQTDAAIRGFSTVVTHGGDPRQAIVFINGKDVCDERFIHKSIDYEGSRDDSAADRYRGGQTNSIDDYVYSLLTAVEARREGRDATKALNARVQKQIGRANGCNTPLFSNLSQISSALDSAVAVDPRLTATSISAFTQKFCENNKFKVNVNNPVFLTATPTNFDELVHTIDQNFDQSRPTGINIHSCLLTNECKTPKDLQMVHAMVIAGRRFNKGNCEYLVRNSYGPDCSDENGKQKYPHACENGSVWFSKSELQRYTLELYYIP